jgi:hypothetical protein
MIRVGLGQAWGLGWFGLIGRGLMCWAKQKTRRPCEVGLKSRHEPPHSAKPPRARPNPSLGCSLLASATRMGSITPNPKKRGYLLPPGCKDLVHVLQGAPKSPSLATSVRINGKIRAQEVRVIGEQGEQFGILSLVDALSLARSRGVDLVEIAPKARPPICRIVDFGRFRYEASKKRKKKP